MKRTTFVLEAVLLVLVAAQASASITSEPVGDPLATHSWDWPWATSSKTATFDMIVVQWDGSSASPEQMLEAQAPVFTFFGDPSWSTKLSTPTLAIATGNATKSLTYYLNFTGDIGQANVQFTLAAFGPNNLVADSDNGIEVVAWHGRDMVLNYTLTGGSDLEYTLDQLNDMIPEPATIVIWSLLGAVGFVGMRWRRRR